MTPEELRSELSASLLRMGRYLIPEMMTAESPPFHYDLDRHLRDVRQRQTVIVSPRGHAKSSVAACLLVVWHLFFENAHREREKVSRITGPRFVVLVSKTKREAQKRLDTIKTVLGEGGDFSRPLRALVGDYSDRTASVWNRDEVRLKDGSLIIAMGTGQQARGLKSGHSRPTLIVADDPEDEQNTVTLEAMTRNMRWLMQALVPALDQRVGRAVVIGTPLNTQCMVVRLKDTVGWRCLWYKNDVAADQCHWYDSATREWVTYKGVLWPTYVTRKSLEQRRESAMSLGMISSYYREYEAVVVGDEDQIFRPDYLQTWGGDIRPGPRAMLVVRRRRGVELETPEEIPVQVVTGVDPASSTSISADKTAIVNIAVDAEDNIYVLPGVFARLRPDEVVASIARNHTQYQPWRGIIETVAAFEYITVYLRRDYGVSYLQDKPQSKKVGEGSRIESLQPLFARGKIHLWDGPEVWDVAKSQLLSYPRGEDDWLDALEKACRVRRPAWAWSPSAEKEGPARRSFDPMVS